MTGVLSKCFRTTLISSFSDNFRSLSFEKIYFLLFEQKTGETALKTRDWSIFSPIVFVCIKIHPCVYIYIDKNPSCVYVKKMTPDCKVYTFITKKKEKKRKKNYPSCMIGGFEK